MQTKIRNLRRKLKRARTTYDRIARQAALEPEFLHDSETGYLSDDEILNGVLANMKRAKLGKHWV